MSIVFTDSFTVASDVDPNAYGGPDYAYVVGSALQVNAASDHLRDNIVAGTDKVVRIISASVPSGDQQISADCGVTSGYDGGYVASRCSLNNGYVLLRANATTLELYRIDSGVFSATLKSTSGTFADNSVLPITLKATGTNPVLLEWTVGVTSDSYFDSDANRKQTGTPGVGVFNGLSSAALCFVDNISVDNLISSSPPSPVMGRRIWVNP